MDIVPFFIPNTEPTVLKQPRECGLDDPAVLSQATAVLGIAFGDQRQDAAIAKGSPNLVLGVVRPIGEYRVGALARTAPRSCNGFDGVDERDGHLRVVNVGAGMFDRQRRAIAVDDQVALRAVLPAICRIRAGLVPPKSARVEQLSIAAADQSIPSAWPSSSSRACHTLSQTPASSQSRRRRQHVMPQPQPISCGRYSHGMPVLSTKRIPVRVARSGTRGRPPLGLGGSGGMNGSIRSHSSSVSSGLAIGLSSMTYQIHRQGHRSCRRYC